MLLAACCWGLENNYTRKISSKDPLQIVLLLGFVAYGLSIYTYVYAQRLLGASRTSAYYAIAPFIGVFLSLIIFQEIPGITFFIALLFMMLGAWLSSSDTSLKDVFSLPLQS